MPEKPTLPPTSTPAKARSRKVIDLARAVATMSTVPVLDQVKRRMFRDWLRGVRPRALRLIYRSGNAVLKVDEVNDVLREVAAENERRAA
jgi:hypothetical protein